MRKPTRKNPMRPLPLKTIKEEPNIKLKVLEAPKIVPTVEKFEKPKPNIEPVSDDFPAPIVQAEKIEPKLKRKSNWSEKKAEQLRKAREAKKTKKAALNKELADLRAFKLQHSKPIPINKVPENPPTKKSVPVRRQNPIQTAKRPPPPRMTKEMYETQFFNLLDKWEERKKVKARPHPNQARLPKPKPPKPPINPFRLYNIKQNRRRSVW